MGAAVANVDGMVATAIPSKVQDLYRLNSPAIRGRHNGIAARVETTYDRAMAKD